MKENECEYCTELFTGDCNDDLITHDLNINVNGINFENVQFNVFIMDDELELFADYYDAPIIKQKVKINYCPMCGRRLVKNVT